MCERVTVREAPQSPPVPESAADSESTPPAQSVPEASVAGEELAADRPAPERRRRRQLAAVEVLTALAVLYTAYLAKSVLMPVVMAMVLTLLLRPLVRRCRRYRIPDAVSGAAVLVALLLLVGTALVNLVGPAREWIDNAPAYMTVVGKKLRGVREQIDDLNEATEKVKALAEGETTEPKQPDSLSEWIAQWGNGDNSGLPDEEQPVAVEVRQPRLMAGLTVISTTGGVLAAVVITVVLTYFLLATGDRLLNNVLHVLPTFREKRNVVELVYEVERGVSSYLLTVTLINIGLGVAIGTAMWFWGVPNPALWGAMATVLNFIPYLGALTGTIVIALVAVFAFDSPADAALVPLTYFALTALEGNLITPTLLGRKMSLNPVVVFVSLVFWGWMWGVGGALLAVPILAIFKVGCDQFERTRPWGTLLGG